MKSNGLIRLLGVLAVMLIVSLACFGGAAPTQAPVQQPPVQEPVEQPQEPVNNNSGSLTTFTDQNDLYSIDIPADWTYEHSVSDDGTLYVDTFTSPDELAVVENIVYEDEDGTAGRNKGLYALYLLNTYYSTTGQEGDIRVSSDQIMQDGSERLEWSSRSGDYSGVSFLESRGTDYFLFFTVDWADSAEEQYREILDAVIESYRIP
jgi:hypothetical protein